MNQRPAHVILLAQNYDEVVAFYTTVPGFALAANCDLGAAHGHVAVSKDLCGSKWDLLELLG